MMTQRESLFEARPRHCWLRLRAHRWSRWVGTMAGSFSRCETCGVESHRNFVETYIR